MKDFLLEAPPASPFGTHVSPAGFLPDGGIAAGNRQGHVSAEPARRGLLLAEPRLGTRATRGHRADGRHAFRMVQHLMPLLSEKGGRGIVFPEDVFSYIFHYCLSPSLEAREGKSLERVVHHRYPQCPEHSRFTINFVP